MKVLQSTGLIISIFLIFISSCKKKTEGPYFATGIKIGEVTDKSVLIWVRLTTDSLPAGPQSPMPVVRYRDPASGQIIDEISGNRDDFSPVVSYPESHNIHSIQGATIGTEGDVMIYYKPERSNHWEHSEWITVDPQRDYTAQIELTDLAEDHVYELKAVSRYPNSTTIGETLQGKFKTAPEANVSCEVLFAVSTGQAFGDQDAPEGGYKIYDAMLRLDIDFFVHTGDILYYDNLAKNEDLARWHWSRMYSLPTNLRFHRRVASYFIKDDHDTWLNDCWPGYETEFMGDFTFEQGQAIFLEQVPMYDKTYRTFRWGKDLQIWLMEGRDFRSPNTDPDGPQKTIWGDKQKKWLYQTVQESDATFKLLISPTPIVGPDRLNKHDNHSNKDFSYEGNEVRKFISEQDNMFVICGDRHWQYVSKDANTGIIEYSCGPASNQHAGGWSNDMLRPEHLYLNVTGGFLTGMVKRYQNAPHLIMTHFSVDGVVLNSDTIRVR